MTIRLSPTSDLERSTKSGVSEASQKLQYEIAPEVDRIFREPISWRWKDDLEEDVIEILEECEEEGWDGYGAKPIKPENKYRIKMILDLLQYNLLPPEIIPEPDGYLSFEWRRDDVAFSVTVEPCKLVYAAILGAGRTQHGEEPFYGDDLPEAIKDILTKYFLNV
ncbi:MAG TPA: hypothetical protein ENI77_00320 [Nitrospirae bacterium]|nr:hypothetical protein [Nitrospirota bacterium]